MSALPQRKSPRLKDYDYSQEGAYFVTICVQDHLSLFGNVAENVMILSNAGMMLGKFWTDLPNKFDDVHIDLWVVMPNHFHGIVIINRYPQNHQQTSIPQAMQWFKTITTNAYIRGIKSDNWQRFNKRLWQHSYHDHIIRNEPDLNRIREYVLTNPARWKADTFYDA